MAPYRIRTGDVDDTGEWQQRSYDEQCDAADLDGAMNEADRRLKDDEIKATEDGEFIRVDGADGSARRAINHGEKWIADRT